jgi:ribonucleoside-triphosphate reductase
VDHATRVIGYLKRVSNFSSGRQREHGLRHYHLQQDDRQRLMEKRTKILSENQKTNEDQKAMRI